LIDQAERINRLLDQFERYILTDDRKELNQRSRQITFALANFFGNWGPHEVDKLTKAQAIALSGYWFKVLGEQAKLRSNRELKGPTFDAMDKLKKSAGVNRT
jgi:hypothetical protein